MTIEIGHCFHFTSGAHIAISINDTVNWVEALRFLSDPNPPTKEIRLCFSCATNLPSYITSPIEQLIEEVLNGARAPEPAHEPAPPPAPPSPVALRPDTDSVENIAKSSKPEHSHIPTMATPESGFICRSCEKIEIEQDEFGTLRECSRDSCGTTFISDERNCPDCNSPFTRKNADMACNDCEQEVEEILVQECENCSELYEIVV